MAGRRRESGGIAYLGGLIQDHAGALDHDLITRTRYTLDDVPESLGWSQLLHFVRYLKPGSALYDELHPERSTMVHGDVILMDIYDLLSAFMWAYGCANSKSKPDRPKPYPRPWVEEKGTKRYGKNPIPISEFKDWYYRRSR